MLIIFAEKSPRAETKNMKEVNVCGKKILHGNLIEYLGREKNQGPEQLI